MFPFLPRVVTPPYPTPVLRVMRLIEDIVLVFLAVVITFLMVYKPWQG